jgi:pyrroline-5-carboxylate reductase
LNEAHSNIGSLGTAILKGFLDGPIDGIELSEIYLSTKSQHSAERLGFIQDSTNVPVHVFYDIHGHLEVIAKSDIVVLACPPDSMSSVLNSDFAATRQSLKGKVLVSVLAGVTREAIQDKLHGSVNQGMYVSRVLPNLAVARRRSATAIEISEPELPSEKQKIVDSMFKALGGIIHVPAAQMDAATVLCGSLPAYIALIADGMIDGAIAAGVPREKANAMLSQVIGSTAALLEDQSASSLRESVCAMPGCTIQGNLVLEEGSARAVSAKAVKVAIEAARNLG